MIHIYDCVTHIRKQRVLLVQTLVRFNSVNFMYCKYMTLYMYAVRVYRLYSACMHVYAYTMYFAMCGLQLSMQCDEYSVASQSIISTLSYIIIIKFSATSCHYI